MNVVKRKHDPKVVHKGGYRSILSDRCAAVKCELQTPLRADDRVVGHFHCSLHAPREDFLTRSVRTTFKWTPTDDRDPLQSASCRVTMKMLLVT